MTKLLFSATISTILAYSYLPTSAYGYPSGIYKIDDKVDSKLLSQVFPPFKSHNPNVKQSYEREYEVAIGGETNTTYAVVAKNVSDGYGSKVNKVILLETGKLTSMEDVTYTDNVVRKYAGFSFKVEKIKNSNKQSWSTANGMWGFYKYRPAIHSFAIKSDYENHDTNSSYETVYDDNTFYSSKDKFILKSYGVKSFMLSSVVEEPQFSIFAPRLKEAKYKLIQKAATFRLHKPRKYIDILSIQKKLSFWTSGKKMSLNSGDFLALTSKDDDWYYGDFVYNDGKYISGKILINDTFDGSKSIQNTKNYTLKIFHSVDDDKHREYLPMMAQSEIYEFKIYGKKNKLIQTIRNPGYSLKENGHLALVDVNFDGYDDLMIYSHDGGAGPNVGYNFYIFNPKANRFEFDQILSDISQPDIDVKGKKITAAWRNGAAEHGGEEYRWLNGQFVMTKQVVQSYMFDEDRVRVTTCTVSKKKQKCKTKYEKAEDY